MNPNPDVMPVANILPELWSKYKPNTDLETGQRCLEMLQDAGFEVEEDDKQGWMIDVLPVMVAMFPDGCPPTTVISLNSRFDPFQHARMGAVLRPLRAEGYLFIGSGGGVHNLYRTEWKYMLKYKDNFAMEKPPDYENMEFRTALEDVIVKNGGGPGLRRGLARLMKHPYFRDAHGSDEHYIPALFVAGAIGEPEDVGAPGVLGAECWELVSRLPLLPFSDPFGSHAHPSSSTDSLKAKSRRDAVHNWKMAKRGHLFRLGEGDGSKGVKPQFGSLQQSAIRHGNKIETQSLSLGRSRA